MSAPVDPNRRDRRLSRRRGKWIALAMLTVFMAFYLRLFFSDPPASDHSDLYPPRYPEVTNDRNAAWLRLQAEKVVDGSAHESIQLAWDASEFSDLSIRIGPTLSALRDEFLATDLVTDIASALEGQAETLTWLDRAAAADGHAPAWEFDLEETFDASPFEIPRVIALRILHDWAEGRPDEAWRRLTDERRRLRQVSEFPSTSTDLIVQLSAEIREYAPARLALVLETERTLEQLRRWGRDLESPLLFEGWRVRALERDFQVTDRFFAVDIQTEQGLRDWGIEFNEFVYRPNRTRASFSEQYRTWIEGARAGRIEEPTYDEPTRLERIGWFLGGNFSGEALLHLTFSYGLTFDRQKEAAMEVEALAALTRVALALRLHQIVTGSWPESLDALVPEFLTVLPPDPYVAEGAPLRWSPEDRRLWSVGPDGIDGGGTSAESFEERLAGSEPTVVFPGS